MYVAKMGQREENLLETKDAIYADYVRDRMGEAYEMVATRPAHRRYRVCAGLSVDAESAEI